MNSNTQSRTEHSARNIKYATVGRVIAILVGYVSRVVFTHTLSQAYVGINGLFTDILNVLSVTELGFGTAISYALYKPIAEGDIEKQKALMSLFKKFYMIVALIVAILGFSVLPFLKFLIKGNTEVQHVHIIYCMYVLMTVFSYFCIYKRTLMDAYQMNYIGELVFSVVISIQSVIQIFVLYFTHNFYIYIALFIAGNILNNLIVSMEADKRYPFLKDKNIRPVTKEEKEGISKNVKAMLMHKLGDVVVNNTDNLLLSSVVGIIAAGLYSNYFLVVESVKIVLNQAFNSITGSVGNLGATSDKERVKKIYEALFFMGSWVYGLCAVCLLEALDIFVGISFGEQYIFDRPVTIMLCINFYIAGMRMATLTFRNTLGLFYYDRYKSIFTAIINLVASIILGMKFGALGIFMGTFVSTILTSFWVEPYVLYKKYFKENVWPYFGKYAVYTITTVVLGLVCELLCSCIHLGNFISMIIRAGLSFAIMNLGYLLVFHKSREFKLLWEKGMYIINKKGRFIRNGK
ncbi:MAG: lipopolysaccharide biosynthesis protein [Lachnospiraceae bacterium]|nr:lipopolysaccharide biosynthesis protein [Lachnospiraceae bacterium]